MDMNMKLNLTDLLSNKNLNIKNIVNILIILITLIVAINLFKSQGRNIQLLKERQEQETKKNALLGNISQLEKKIVPYKNTFNKNKKDISLVLNTVSNIANESNMKIISIRPNKEQDFPEYSKYSFDLVAGTDSYHVLGQFISNLESHPDVYMVDRFDLKIGKKHGTPIRILWLPEELESTQSLNIQITLSTIVLKD